MTTLVFHHEGYEVATSAWTACAKADAVDIAYVWGADRISWASSATGVARVTLPITFKRFIELVARAGDGLADLRGYR